MTGRELLVVQGFPAYDSLLRDIQPWIEPHQPPIALCSFNLSRARVNLPPRSRKEFGHMAGNAMTVPIVAAVIQHILMHVVEEPTSVAPVFAPLLTFCTTTVHTAAESESVKSVSASDVFLTRVHRIKHKKRRTSVASPRSSTCSVVSIGSSSSDLSGAAAVATLVSSPASSISSISSCDAIVVSESQPSKPDTSAVVGAAACSRVVGMRGQMSARRQSVLALPSPVMNSIVAKGHVEAARSDVVNSSISDSDAHCDAVCFLSSSAAGNARVLFSCAIIHLFG